MKKDITCRDIENALQEVIDQRNSIKQQITETAALLKATSIEVQKAKMGLLDTIFGSDAEFKVEDLKRKLDKLTDQLDKTKLDADQFMSANEEDHFFNLFMSVDALAASKKIWLVEDGKVYSKFDTVQKMTSRRASEINISKPELFDSKTFTFYFDTGNGTGFYLFPGFVLYHAGDDNYRVLDHALMTVKWAWCDVLESNDEIGEDAQVISREPLVVRYCELIMRLPGEDDKIFYISHAVDGMEFGEKYNQYIIDELNWNKPGDRNEFKYVVSDENVFGFPRDYYTLLKEFGDDLVEMNKKIGKLPMLQDIGNTKTGETSADIVSKGIVYDLGQLTRILSENTLAKSSINAAGLALVSSKIFPKADDDFLLLDYEPVRDAYLKGSLNGIIDKLVTFTNERNPFRNEIVNSASPTATKGALENKDLAMSKFLKMSHSDLSYEYNNLLYRFSNILTKVDGFVSKGEEEILKGLYQMIYDPLGEQKTGKIVAPVSEQSITDALAELNQLTGLEHVKQEVNTLVNLIKIQQQRQKAGLTVTSLSHHLVFTGNPGTGKTTVARIVAKIFRALGVLSGGQLIETDRSGLVAEYVGQTGIKTNKIVDSAVNGVLFVDEAYTLRNSSDQDFGNEAIATLLKRMEDDRDKLVVVVAGYPDLMNTFIESNPGLKSRFNKYIVFEDYSPDELCTIYTAMCKKGEYNLSADAVAKAKTYFESACATKDKTFGNARLARNIFEKTLECQANRIAGIAPLTKEILITIEAADINLPQTPKAKVN